MTRPLILAAIVAIATPAVAAAVIGTDALREGKHVVLGYLQSSSKTEGPGLAGGHPDGASPSYRIATPVPAPADHAVAAGASTPRGSSPIVIPEGAEWPLLLFAVVGLLIGRRMSRSIRSHTQR
jgi:hypothetical protein